MWNFIDLKCPSDDMVVYELGTGAIEELRDIVNIFTTAANVLTSENPLWSEIYVLRNIQVKYKRLLRCDKSLIHLHRVSHCLKKMVLLNVSKSCLDIAERFLMGFSSQDSSKTVCLPSQQQVEYILIRFLSAAKLICDAVKYSRETFCFLLQKIKIGHMILDLVMAASVIAKLVIMLKAILEEICNMYEKMFPWRLKLRKGNFQWAEKIDLPKNVKMWLDSFAADVLKPVPISKNDIQKISGLLKPNDQSDNDADSVIFVKEVIGIGDQVSDSKEMENGTDYGEVIPRKKISKTVSLTCDQKTLLLRIQQAENLEDLENMWMEIKNVSLDGNKINPYLPKVLNSGKKKVISNFFSRIREGISKKNVSKKMKQPKFLNRAVAVFCKHLGFTENQIEMCHNKQEVSNLVPLPKIKLEPVKTLKGLKLLFKHLYSILEFSSESEKLKELKKIFKSRKTGIALLRQNGEKYSAKQLIFCTSKALLNLCQ